MARRVSWVNNSSGHNGTYVYRAETLDPQNLPAPVATVDPVAQGETAEWIDDFTGYECYAVQDFDGQGAGALSDEVCVTDPWAGVQIGDYIGGGVYIGNKSIGGTNYRIIMGLTSSEIKSVVWANAESVTGATDVDDGLANTEALIGLGISGFPAAEHCVNYSNEGFDDWYLPSENEFLMANNIDPHPEFPSAGDHNDFRWTSSEYSSTGARVFRFSTNSLTGAAKTSTYSGTTTVRPFRRVPV